MTKKFETLYARNSDGNINQWLISVETLRDTTCLTHIEEGVLDGKLTETVRATKTGKNLGKMNESSPYQQACSEAESRWTKKKKQGYKSLKDLNIKFEDTESIQIGELDYSKPSAMIRTTFENLKGLLNIALPENRTDANNITKPMKAQPYFKDNGDVRITFPCLGQPKLNGFRCIARWEKVIIEQGTLYEEEKYRAVFRSKEGLSYDILDHIAEEFTEDMFKWNINGKEIKLAFDGEMYIHGEILSEISSAVRKRNPKTALLKFCIFDLAIPDLRQDERTQILGEMNRNFHSLNLKNVIIIGEHTIVSNEEAQEMTDYWIKGGYEGGIFRAKSATYAFGSRPKTMVKLKRSMDKEFKIVDVIGGDNSPELGVFVCLQEEGLTFNCTPEGSHEVKREYLTNKDKYIGKNLTVRFFERTKDNKPFHAVGVAIRDYE